MQTWEGRNGDKEQRVTHVADTAVLLLSDGRLGARRCESGLAILNEVQREHPHNKGVDNLKKKKKSFWGNAAVKVRRKKKR